MRTFEESFEIMMAAALPPAGHRIPLIEAYGCVLMEDVFSDMSMPPFDKAGMDGYACRRADLDEPLTVIETIPAGVVPQCEIGPGQCAKIMTGAKVPAGADLVVMMEQTREANGRVIVEKKDSRTHIRPEAEDVRVGDKVLSKGVWIGPPEMAVLAAVGCAEPKVALKPRVGIIATGCELVEPKQKPGPVQIRNSNSSQLWAQVLRAGATPSYYGIAPDEPQGLTKTIRQALDKCDLLLLSGGVSMGDYDFVPKVLTEMGVKILFDKVAVKPGKPTVFGTTEGCRIVGLPGNPVSGFVVFELMVRPFIARMLGSEYRPLKIRTKPAMPVRREKAGRMENIPVKFQIDGRVMPISYHGSAHIHAFTTADAMIQLPIGKLAVEENEAIEVILLGRGG